MLLLAVLLSLCTTSEAASASITASSAVYPLYFVRNLVYILINPYLHLKTFFKTGVSSHCQDTHSSRLLIVFSIYSLAYLAKIVYEYHYPSLIVETNRKSSYLGISLFFISTLLSFLCILISPWRLGMVFRNISFNNIATLVILLGVTYVIISLETVLIVYDICRFSFLLLFISLISGQDMYSPLWNRWQYRLFCIFIPGFCILHDYTIKFIVGVAIFQALTFRLFASWELMEIIERIVLILQSIGRGRDIALDQTSGINGGLVSVLAVDHNVAAAVLPTIFASRLLQLIINVLPKPGHSRDSLKRAMMFGLILYLCYITWLSMLGDESCFSFKPPILMDSAEYVRLDNLCFCSANNVAKRAGASIKSSVDTMLSISYSQKLLDFLSIFFTGTTPLIFCLSMLYLLLDYFSWEFYTFCVLNALTLEPGKMRSCVLFSLFIYTLVSSSPLFIVDESTQKKFLLSPVLVSKLLLSLVQLILHLFIFPTGTVSFIHNIIAIVQGPDPNFITSSLIISLFILPCSTTEEYMFDFMRRYFSLPFLLAEFGIGADGTFSAAITTMDPSTTLDYPNKVTFYPLERSPVAILIDKITKHQDTHTPSVSSRSTEMSSSTANKPSISSSQIDGHIPIPQLDSGSSMLSIGIFILATSTCLCMIC